MTMSPSGFAALLMAKVHAIKEGQTHGLEQAAEIWRNGAQQAIGTYELGWPKLAASTLEKKGADTPLWETGQLRDSIEKKVADHEAWVGSSDPKAEWHELGTPSIPPRSFIAASGKAHEGEIVKAMAAPVALALGSSHGTKAIE